MLGVVKRPQVFISGTVTSSFHLVTTGTDGWAKRDLQIMRFDVVPALE
jgi:hypothetical protein